MDLAETKNHLYLSRLGKGLNWILLYSLFWIPLIYCRYVNANFVTTKYMSLCFIGPLCLLLMMSWRNILFPRGKIALLLIAMAMFRLISFALHPSFHAFDNLMDAFIFLVLMIYFLNHFLQADFKKELDIDLIFWPFTLMLGVIYYYCFTDYYFPANNDFSTPSRIYGTFGNVNMATEFLGLSLPFLWRAISEATGWKKRVLQTSLVLHFYIILIAQCRSVWIGAGVFILFQLTQVLPKKFKYVAFALIIAVVGAIGNWVYPLFIAKNKADSTSIRLILYQSSFDMLLDNPLGVGGNSFEFNFTPYQLANGLPVEPNSVFNTPHDEFLKLGIEQGWGFLLCFLVAIGGAAWYAFKGLGNKVQNNFHRSMICVMLPQLIFQFPFETPASMLWLSFFFASLLSLMPITELKLKSVFKVILVIISLFLVFRAGAYAKSRFWEGLYSQEVDSLQTACEIYPSNRYACNFYSDLLVRNRMFPTALEAMKGEYLKRPMNWSVAWELSNLYFQRNMYTETCKTVRVLEVIMGKRISYGKVYDDMCNSVPLPVKFENVTQFREDYIKWLGDALNAQAK